MSSNWFVVHEVMCCISFLGITWTGKKSKHLVITTFHAGNITFFSHKALHCGSATVIRTLCDAPLVVKLVGNSKAAVQNGYPHIPPWLPPSRWTTWYVRSMFQDVGSTRNGKAVITRALAVLPPA
ncbi:hypothetical protein C8J56DRAFT_890216 [Mycena floridula]|nr:hypothetical protein C8J56DRAFT_890216 [Mycena floridula]